MTPDPTPAPTPSSATTEHSPLPWHVSTNGFPAGDGREPAFPGVEDSSGGLNGEDAVCFTVGTNERCKANAALIVKAVNAYAALAATPGKSHRHENQSP